MSTDSTEEFDNSVIERTSNASSIEDFFTESGVTDSELELLFLAWLSSGQVGS